MASMGTLTLIRHGQASFGAADYDQLSEIGQEQSRRLGAYLGHKNVHADVVYRGSLKRHAQTWMGMQEGLALTLGASYQAAVATVNPALDEYDGEALINAVKTDAPNTPPKEQYMHKHISAHALHPQVPQLDPETRRTQSCAL